MNADEKKSGYFTQCNMELAQPIQLTIPSRFCMADKNASRAEIIKDLKRLGETFTEGMQAMAGLYLRMTDTIRENNLSDEEVRAALGGYFPPSRISELIRVASAPKEIYSAYSSRLIGFRATLEKVRMYRVPICEELSNRKLRRAAARLVALCNGKEITLHIRCAEVRVRP